MKYKSCIILPLKESFSNTGFGAVSLWVQSYLNYSNLSNDLIFCRKLEGKQNYLNKNICKIKSNSNFFTNKKYIDKISTQIKKRKITHVEIHNRPEYAYYLIEKNPGVKINLIFHNDPVKIRYSNKINNRLFLLNKCNKVIFVSKWLKGRYLEGLDLKHKNNIEIIYNFIHKIHKFPRKEKIIIFSGKLNKSKGFEIFGKSIINVLKKYPDWKAIVFGNEQRETYSFNHSRLKINNWVSHKKLLKFYEKSSISVVNPTWDEPFGRTAMESASRGCAVITSISGGLSETFKNNIVLKKNNSNEITKKISELINNPKKLKEKQIENFKNVIHTPKNSIFKLDKLRQNKNVLRNNLSTLRILHISNFGLKYDHRIFNISIAKKLSNGFIRNGHDVIDFDYKSYTNFPLTTYNIDKKILSIVENYRTNLVLFGHNNILNKNTLELLKKNYKCSLALWYEDHVVKGDPNFRKNLDLIEKNHGLIDQYFITTAPSKIKTIIPKIKINFLPIPVDPNIEYGHFYENPKEKDLFFAISHGVNFGKLKKNRLDSRSHFINNLINNSDNNINYHFLGMYDHQPKWNHNFNKDLMISKTALNLSRGGPTKYCSSNRIASYMGNGVLPFIHEDVKYQDFFDNDEIITYKNSNDLISKLILIKENKNKLVKLSKRSKKKYFDIFENKIISDFIIHKIFGIKNKFKFIWDN